MADTRVILTSTAGEQRSVISGGAGQFEFAELAHGETYTISPVLPAPFFFDLVRNTYSRTWI